MSLGTSSLDAWDDDFELGALSGLGEVTVQDKGEEDDDSSDNSFFSPSSSSSKESGPRDCDGITLEESLSDSTGDETETEGDADVFLKRLFSSTENGKASTPDATAIFRHPLQPPPLLESLQNKSKQPVPQVFFPAPTTPEAMAQWLKEFEAQPRESQLRDDQPESRSTKEQAAAVTRSLHRLKEMNADQFATVVQSIESFTREIRAKDMIEMIKGVLLLLRRNEGRLVAKPQRHRSRRTLDPAVVRSLALVL